MAIVTGITEKGEKSYRSIKNLGFISDKDILKANELNDLISKKIKSFLKEHNLKGNRKSRVSDYWNFGKMLHELFFDSGLADKNEKELFFVNVRLHMDKAGDIFPKNDVKRNRNIPKQFFKLASYPFEIATRIEWAQWSFLFDYPYLMESTGFDKWFSQILKSDKYKFNEGFTRLWAESFILLFKNTDLENWSEQEKLKPIICTLEIIYGMVNEGISIEDREVRKKLRSFISIELKSHKKEFIHMQMKRITEEDFINLILKRIIDRVKSI